MVKLAKEAFLDFFYSLNGQQHGEAMNQQASTSTREQ
jgi:hypothetical protein